MTRKRLLIVAGAITAAVLAGLLGGFGMMERLWSSDDGLTKVGDGRDLYGDIMGRHPLLLDRSSFEPGAADAGSEVTRMRLPQSEWLALDQPQKNSLAQYLESMGSSWQIEVGSLTKDGQRIRSFHPVMTSDQWHDVVK